MNPTDLKTTEANRQKLLGQLTIAESALRNALHVHGFGETTRTHMERAKAHICEAYIAINEAKQIRSVEQLTDDLTRIEKVVSDAKRSHSQRI
jgi:phage-related tail protein